MQVDVKCDWRSIAQIYSQSLFKKLAVGASLDVIRLAAEYSPLKSSYRDFSLGEILDQLYFLLQSNYRNEYVYKNTIAQKIVIERHVSKAAKLLTEFRVNKSKADAVVLNGTSTVYEIKTEYDDLSRLAGQLLDYQKIFDKIYVVTHSEGVDRVLQNVSPHIGVIALSEGFALHTLRSATSNISNVDSFTIFDSLRQSEYLDILLRKFDFVPTGSKFGWYVQCKQQFGELTPQEAHYEMLHVLKARTDTVEFLNFILQLPKSLVAIGLASETSKSHQIRILERLSQPI